MLQAGALGGFVWGGIPGLLRATTGAHEVITTMMMTYIAVIIGETLIQGPWKAPHDFNAETKVLPDAAKLWPGSPSAGSGLWFGNSGLNIGLPIALGCVLIFWYLMWRTNVGYRIRAVGFNPKAARYAGMPVNLYMFLSLAIAGAFSGLGGAIQILGYVWRVTSSMSAGYGVDGIAVAFLGTSTPLGTMLSAFLFGAMRWGSVAMESDAVHVTISHQIYMAIEGIVIVFVAAPYAIRWLTGGKRTALGKLITPERAIVDLDLPEPAKDPEKDLVAEQ